MITFELFLRLLYQTLQCSQNRYTRFLKGAHLPRKQHDVFGLDALILGATLGTGRQHQGFVVFRAFAYLDVQRQQSVAFSCSATADGESPSSVPLTYSPRLLRAR